MEVVVETSATEVVDEEVANAVEVVVIGSGSSISQDTTNNKRTAETVICLSIRGISTLTTF
jgi:hypothetical protein